MKQFFSMFHAVLGPASSIVPPGTAGAGGTEQVVSQHNQAMAARNLERIMADYAESAVLIDPRGVFNGKAAIRQSFAGLLSNPHVVLQPPNRQMFEGELAYLCWSPQPGAPGREAVETLVVRDGKIVAQTVAEFGAPPGAPEQV